MYIHIYTFIHAYMHIYTYIYIFVCTNIYIYIYIYIYIDIHIYIYIHRYTYTHLYIYIDMYTYIDIYIYMYIYVYVYMYIYTYICIYIHVHIYMYTYVNACTRIHICMYQYTFYSGGVVLLLRSCCNPYQPPPIRWRTYSQPTPSICGAGKRVVRSACFVPDPIEHVPCAPPRLLLSGLSALAPPPPFMLSISFHSLVCCIYSIFFPNFALDSVAQGCTFSH